MPQFCNSFPNILYQSLFAKNSNAIKKQRKLRLRKTKILFKAALLAEFK
jgi:hypothetical protein